MSNTTAVLLAFICTIVGIAVSSVMEMFHTVKPECADRNKYHIMEITLFITVFLGVKVYDLFN